MKAYVAAALAIGLVIGCGDPGTGPATPGVWLSPRVIADTIEAWTTIRVVVRDEALRPMANTNVTLSTPEGFPGTVFVPRTDANGTSTIRLRLGVIAGEWKLIARAAGYEDTLRVTVLPGAPVGTIVLPQDTALLRGESFDLHISLRDRRYNPRPEKLQPTAITGGEPTVAVTGATVTAVAEGSVVLTILTDQGNMETRVTVVPHAVLAVLPGPTLLMSTGAPAGEIPAAATAECMRWHPDGTRLLLDGLRVVHLDGSIDGIELDEPGVAAGCGEFSANGEWIYFEGRRDDAWQIWRTRPDGSETSRITSPVPPTEHRFPSPSPDGSRVGSGSGTLPRIP